MGMDLPSSFGDDAGTPAGASTDTTRDGKAHDVRPGEEESAVETSEMACDPCNCLALELRWGVLVKAEEVIGLCNDCWSNANGIKRR